MARTQQTSSPFSFLYYLFFGFLPLIHLSDIMDPSLWPRQFFASLALLTILVFCFFNRGRIVASVAAPVWAWLGFLLINVIAIAAAINPVESYATISHYGLGLAYIITTITLLRSRMISAENLAKAGAIFATVTAFMTLFEIFKIINAGSLVDNIYDIKGTFSHKNLLSSALMLGLPFVIIGAATLDKNWRKYSLGLALLLIAEMFLLRTRGVWISVFIGAGVALFALLIFRKKAQVNIKKPLMWGGAGAALAIVILILFFIGTSFSERVLNRSNLDKRLAFWENSVEMFQEHPFIGVGPGNWKINFPKYKLSSKEVKDHNLDYNVFQGVTQIQRPHNDYLWVLNEGGVLALLFFGATFFVAFYRLAKNLSRINNEADLAVDIATIMGLLAYLTFSLTDFPLERTEHMLLMMTLLALPFRNVPNSKTVFPVIPFVVFSAGLSIFSLVVSHLRIQGERESVEVMEANRSRNALKIIDHSRKAENIFYNMDNYANPLAYYTSLGRLAQRNTEDALTHALKAYEIHPYNIIVLNQVGNVYRLQGDMNSALTYYNKATDISIRMISAQLSKAEIYLQQRDFVRAMESLNFVEPNASNQRYMQLLAKTIPAIISTKNQHQRFSLMIKEVQKQNPRKPMDYARAYVQWRNS